MGVPGAAINVPAICDMIETLKTKKNYDEDNANNMASAIFNFGVNFGEAIGPTLGGYITNKRDFGTSCVYVSILNLMYCILLGGYNYKSIIEYVVSNDKEITPGDYRNMSKDFLQSGKSSRSQSISKEYVGRVRSYSRGNSASKELIRKI
jgi:hypothetical protein